MNQWYVRRNGVVSGPYSLAQLREMRTNGRLSYLDYVARDKVSWRRFSMIDAGVLGTQQPVPAQTVWFVTGLNSRVESYKQVEMDFARRCFPQARVLYRGWDGKNPFEWSSAIGEAEKVVPCLVDEILEMPDKVRAGLVLVGHSLGGRIVVRILARLAERGVRIREAFVLAPAIDDDDSDIRKIGEAALRPIYVCCKPCDYALVAYHIRERRYALGANGSLDPPPGNVFEIRISDSAPSEEPCRRPVVSEMVPDEINHAAKSYLDFLVPFIAGGTTATSGGLVPQDSVIAPHPVWSWNPAWKSVLACNGWTLQRKRRLLGGSTSYRIVHEGWMVAGGSNQDRLVRAFKKASTCDGTVFSYS